MASDEPKTITSQVTQEFYDQFQHFCFENELSKSDVIREGVTLLIKAHGFFTKKNKSDESKAQ